MWRLDEREKRKYEQAARFGLTEKLMATGWAGLSAKDAGRIGGALHGKRKST
ncbi:MAG: small, acid-soluble spore protein, alpha/beta type [Clostridia bacterium]|nr:small, acid-soluble spore protein, alpha/beta type [Clostridia bacterium]